MSLNYDNAKNEQDIIDLFANYFSNVYTDQNVFLHSTSNISQYYSYFHARTTLKQT